MLNIIGVFFIISILGIIIIGNIFLYKKIFNDFFEPTTFYFMFIALFFGTNLLSGYKYSLETILIVFSGSIFYLFGYYLKFKIVTYRKYTIFKFDYIGERNYVTYFGWVILLALLNMVEKILELKSFGISLPEFLNNMMHFAAIHKKGGYVWLILSYPILALNYLNIYSFMKGANKCKFLCIVIGQLIFSFSLLSSSRFNYVIHILFIPLLVKQIFIDKKPIFKSYYILCGIIILPCMIILNHMRHGHLSDINFSIQAFLQYALDSLRGDTVPGRNIDSLVRYLGTHDYYNHGKYFLYQVMALIPRFIWKTKPITSFCFQATIDVFNMDPIIGGTTHTFTIFDTYSISGFLSLWICQFFLGYFSRKIYENLYMGNVFIWLFSLGFITNYINMLRGSWMDLIAFYILYTAVHYIIYIFYIYCFPKKVTKIIERKENK